MIVLLCAPVHAKLSLGDKALLQSVMQQHIERSSVDGAYLYLDPVSGTVQPLQAEASHPMIISMGKYYVLCISFLDEAGKSLDADFYLAPQDRSYVVFQSSVEDRDVLKRLIKAGQTKRVD